ncbi:hypothetical protein MCOR14_007684 [Pyricularia oryzae]|uniref:O-methyltransferase C-terminal domain-containing protein n=1 Tax=Pyricularia oryzae TaxID=318829 RepID=A0A4P7MW92_PYROR|nr:hypothetical protein MCOR34_011175 [Pyricularia oryzae]KAI6446504.1 hypothetical protein MCOR17_010751 [Pyricularia oryzae]KAI6554916.1 hypothetical protein MCOR04_010515 [Pyricularia oryzae]KAI6631695.1 hypothetical protein MCOR14_007684 [Pyricularia oryzae]QBZ54348.1 hypothetical protein PoMZ_10044 [Pyricularia oryzae]
MDDQQRLKTCIDEIALQGPELLRQLQSPLGAPGEAGHGLLDDTSGPTIRSLRKKLIDAATKLIQLTTNVDGYLEHLANGYQELSCVRWLIGLEVLQHMPADGSPISYAHLAANSGTPLKALRGVARMAVANGFLEEPSSGHLAHSRISLGLLKNDSFMSWANWMMEYSMPVAYKFTDATRRWGDTECKSQSAFNLALDTPLPFFDHMRKDQQLTALFSNYMRSVTCSRLWSLDHAVEGFDWASLPNGAKIVDIGGSHGELAVRVLKSFPHLEFIVQDLPETIAAAKSVFHDKKLEQSIKSKIKFAAHDFFKPQPVTDAEVYFLRMVVHDWPDQDAKLILQQLGRVLEQRPQARILVMDTVLPTPGSISVTHEQQLRVRDLMMMQVFNAKERELGDWQTLCDQVGMKITHVSQPDESLMGLLVLQLKDEEPKSNINAINGLATNHKPATDEEPVLIIGAGISGLCLAQALHKGNVPFRIYERDSTVDHRPQGYRLKFQRPAALALSEILSPDIYEAFLTSCAILSVGETDLDPFTAAVSKSRRGGGLGGNLGLNPFHMVDRTNFRKTLIDSIKDRIVYGRELESYQADAESGVVVARFKNGDVVRGRFLVGADGLHSVVRRTHIPRSLLKETGAACIYGKTPLSPELLARFPAKGLRWMTVIADHSPVLQSCFIGDSTVTLLLEPIRFSPDSRDRVKELPDNYLYWALIGPQQRLQFPPAGPQNQDKATGNGQVDAADLSLAVTEEWHPDIRSVLELQDRRQTTLIRVISSVPNVPAWDSSSMVTAIGDAVHPMSPAAGIGAQTAICDAASLGRVLVNSRGCPSKAAIWQFEEDMRKRACGSIERSEVGSRKMFGMTSLDECKTWTG